MTSNAIRTFVAVLLALVVHDELQAWLYDRETARLAALFWPRSHAAREQADDVELRVTDAAVGPICGKRHAK